MGDEEKNPSISGKWRHLATQTREELEGLVNRVGDRATCWGPVCGLGELFSFDFDWPFIYGLWHQHFGERAQTLTYETPNTGARPFFLTTEKMQGDPFESSLHTEFKQSHFVACGGYAHNVDGELRPYKLVKVQPIKRDDRILQDSTKFLYELLEGRYSWLQYNCIRERLSSKRIVLTHKQGLAINGFMLTAGCEDWEIHNFRRTCYDVDESGKHRLEYDQRTTQAQIRSGREYVERGGKPFPCRQTETSEGLAAVFNFDEAGCRGCPRRRENGHIDTVPPVTTRPPDMEPAVESIESFTYTAGEDPWPLEKIRETLDYTIKFDNSTKQLVFHSAVLNFTAEDQVNVGLTGESSIGKTYTVLEVLKFFPEENLMVIGYASPKSFFHSGVLVDEDDNPLPDWRDYQGDAAKKWIEANPRPKPDSRVAEWRAMRKVMEKRAADPEEYLQWIKSTPMPESPRIKTWEGKLAEVKRNAKASWDDIAKFFLVDLHQKIIVFVDAPHFKLLEHLRALLSHDQKEIEIKIVDSTKDGQLSTKRVKLRGYPTCFHLCASFMLSEQEQTRHLLLSPSSTQEKLRAALDLIAERESNPFLFKERVESDELRQALRKQISAVKERGVHHVRIGADLMDNLKVRYLEHNNNLLVPRSQRQFPRLIKLVKARALINFNNRNQEDRCLFAVQSDIDDAFELYKPIANASVLGLPPEVFDIYRILIRGKPDMKRTEFQTSYFKEYQRHLGDGRMLSIIKLLQAVGLVSEVPGEDKRFKLIHDAGSEAVEEDSFNLQEALDVLVTTVRDADIIEGQESLEEEELLEKILLNSATQWDKDTFKKVLKQALKDGVVLRTPDDKIAKAG